MPIYEYQCESCGHRQDALQKISDPPLSDCAGCGEAALRKLVSAPLFRLKGSGWYETDFKKDNRRNLADGGDPAEGKSGEGTKAEGDGAKSGSESSGAGDKASGGTGGTSDKPAAKSTGGTGTASGAAAGE